MFEWDPHKREQNVFRHGLDFGLTKELFDGREMLTRPSGRGGELRFASTCVWDNRYVTVVWTWRGENRRIISLRSARHGERRAYGEILRGRNEA